MVLQVKGLNTWGSGGWRRVEAQALPTANSPNLYHTVVETVLGLEHQAEPSPTRWPYGHNPEALVLQSWGKGHITRKDVHGGR